MKDGKWRNLYLQRVIFSHSSCLRRLNMFLIITCFYCMQAVKRNLYVNRLTKKYLDGNFLCNWVLTKTLPESRMTFGIFDPNLIKFVTVPLYVLLLSFSISAMKSMSMKNRKTLQIE